MIFRGGRNYYRLIVLLTSVSFPHPQIKSLDQKQDMDVPRSGLIEALKQLGYAL